MNFDAEVMTSIKDMDFDAEAMTNIEDMEFYTVISPSAWHEIDDECWFDCDCNN